MPPDRDRLLDDLGHPLPPTDAARIVSLVPSLTEAIAATAPDRLIGCTDWCTHPGDLDARGIRRVRGTKNPDLAAIAALAPDLVVANKEENRELDVRRLRERGIPVWVTDIETVPQAIASMRRMFTQVLAVPEPDWLRTASQAWAGEPPEPTRRVAVAIWRDPWMLVGHPTFTADLLERLGCRVLTPGATDDGRYPHADPAGLDDPRAVDEVLLPDEPYVFTEHDGPEAFTRVPTRLVSGRLLTWYGPSLIDARRALD